MNNAPLEYAFDVNSQTIIAYLGQESHVIIPSELEGTSVLCIAENAFSSRQLSSVTIPSTVKTIGKAAFKYCKLEEVVLSEGLEVIEEEAFAYNEIGKIKLPKSLLEIGEQAFLVNRLTSVEMWEHSFDDGCFGPVDRITFKFNSQRFGTSRKDRTTLVEHSSDGVRAIVVNGNGVIPKDVNILGKRCYVATPSEVVVIPESVTMIEEFAFDFVKLERIVIPDTVKHIHKDALEDVVFDSKLIIAGSKGSYAEQYALAGGYDFEEHNFEKKVLFEGITGMISKRLAKSNIFSR